MFYYTYIKVHSHCQEYKREERECRTPYTMCKRSSKSTEVKLCNTAHRMQLSPHKRKAL